MRRRCSFDFPFMISFLWKQQNRPFVVIFVAIIGGRKDGEARGEERGGRRGRGGGREGGGRKFVGSGVSEGEGGLVREEVGVFMCSFFEDRMTSIGR